MKYNIAKALALTFPIALLISCTTTTKLTSHWYEKSYEKGNIKKLLILGISKREPVRRIFEEDMVKKLEYYQVEGYPSYQVFAMEQKLDTAAFRLHFMNQGFDAVITSQLVAADKEVHQDPGMAYGGYGYRGGFYGYYGSSYDYMYSPASTYTTTTLRIETNLYDVKTEKLIWSGLSETFNPNDEADAIRSLNHTITLELNKQGYFHKSVK